MAIIWERAAKDNRQSADVKLPHQLNCTTLLCWAAKTINNRPMLASATSTQMHNASLPRGKDNRQSADVKLPTSTPMQITLRRRAAKRHRQSADVKLPQHQLKCTTLLPGGKDNRQSADVKLPQHQLNAHHLCRAAKTTDNRPMLSRR